jgi:molybdopterin-synthase adenylyltransferase
VTASRYSRQELFAGIGREGQARLGAARVVVVGCGALGSVASEMMVRAGAASVTVIDRDFVEESNLQRQSLFDEADVALGMPKAAAAEAHLRALNSDVTVRGIVTDFVADNADTLLAGADLVLDGTDNFETRFLLNDVCVRAGLPWVYGACVGSYGLALLVRPKVSPCLRCLLEERPAPGSGPTCDTAGVVAGIQVAEALKLLSGHTDALLPGLVTVDLWQSQFDVLDLRGRAPWCPACTSGQFDYAVAGPAGGSAVLCGRDAVQVRPGREAQVDLGALAERVGASADVRAVNEHLVRFVVPEGELVVFRDGRAIVKNVRDTAQARSLYAKYVGV